MSDLSTRTAPQSDRSAPLSDDLLTKMAAYWCARYWSTIERHKLYVSEHGKGVHRWRFDEAADV